MKILRIQLLWIGLFFYPFFSVCQAQQTADPTSGILPDWVRMMDDTAVNYNDAVKAFEAFWQGRENPLEEIEEREKYGYSPERESEIREKLRELSPEEASWRQEMIWQCKRFEEWQRDVKPFVQNDGRILTPSERKVMEQERNRQLKAAEGKEGKR